MSSHVVAVAKKTCQPVADNSSALRYTAGDHISVVRRASSDVFEGSINGKSGSFLASDVVFHRGGCGVAMELCSHHAHENRWDTLLISTPPCPEGF